jgi:hypothetical protein
MFMFGNNGGIFLIGYTVVLESASWLQGRKHHTSVQTIWSRESSIREVGTEERIHCDCKCSQTASMEARGGGVTRLMGSNTIVI